MTTAYLAFGSNLGDRLAALANAVTALRAKGQLSFTRISSVYETAPVGIVEQPPFLNLVAEVLTTLSPSALLRRCLEIEAEAGRIRGERWGPRILDVDVLWYDDQIIAADNLTLPHPRMLERAFVLIPLAEIAPHLNLRGETAASRAAGIGSVGVVRVGRLPTTLVVEKIPGWGDPIDAFAMIAERSGSFFLDSALPGGGDTPYSFVGCEPFMRLRGTHERTVYFEGNVQKDEAIDVLVAMRDLLQRFKSGSHPALPFVGGAVGYLTYEYGAQWEGLARKNPEVAIVEFGFYDGLLAYEHATRQWYLVANPVHDASVEQIRQRIHGWFQPHVADIPPRTQSGTVASSNLNRSEYLAGVKRIQSYIAAGDVYQTNLAHRFEGKWHGGGLALYFRMREATAAPFGCYFRASVGEILSCSPERFLRLKGSKVQTRPIKGTRPRGKTRAEDAILAAELLASAKERSELLMIVDLERNDLGRVCQPGTISVAQLYEVEIHPTVIHLVATVEGKLRENCDVFDLLRACFPGGSITGAPKIRAMQIIEELESAPRGVYTGTIGYIGFDGSCDLSIAIRTVVLEGDRASYHVGAGIVWDSDPESEYEETLAKGRALQWAIAGEKSK